MEIYERIKHLRKNELKLTQEEFVSKINISRSNLGSIEVGRINLTDRVIFDICSAYNINENWLKTGEGEMFRKIPEEDETAALVSELLEDVNNPFYDIIKEIMRTYVQLDDKSQTVLRRFSTDLLKNLNSKKEG